MLKDENSITYQIEDSQLDVNDLDIVTDIEKDEVDGALGILEAVSPSLKDDDILGGSPDIFEKSLLFKE